MSYFDEQLDLTNARIEEIEKNLAIFHENILTVSEQLKETQVFLVRLAKNQAEISKRLSSWPFIAVPERDEGDKS